MKHIIPLGLVSLALAGSALAQDTSTPPAGGARRGPPGHGPRPNPVVFALDTDRNREISAAEIANAAVSLRGLDTNNDGTIAADELRPARPANSPARPAPPADAPARMRPVDPVMLALDANSDGALNAAEIANAAASLGALDANRDGKLTRDELHPLPPEGAEGRGPRGPRAGS